METIFSGLSAFVEICITLIQLLCRGFVNLLRSATDGNLTVPKRRRLALISLLQISGTLLVVAGVWFFFAYLDHQSSKRSRMRKDSELAVHQMANELDKQLDRDGRYVRAANPLTQADAWGQPLSVSYSENQWSESVEVASAGRDQKLGTPDDISTVRLNLRAGDIAKNTAEKMRKKAKEQFSKLIPQDEAKEQ